MKQKNHSSLPPRVRFRTQVEPPGKIGSTELRMWSTSSGATLAHSGPHGPYWKQSQTDMTDVVTPGYAQRIAAGEIVNNPMSKVSVLYGTSNGTGMSLTKPGYDLSWESTGDIFCHIGFPEPPYLDALNHGNLVRLAQTSALAGVAKPEIQSLVALGELHKTLTMVVSPIRGLQKLLAQNAANYKRDLAVYGNPLNKVMKIKGHTKRAKALGEFKRYARDVKRPDSRSLTERLEFIPDMVLCYNLGWKPLMMDLKALLSTIPEKELHERRTSRGRASDSYSYSLPKGGMGFGEQGTVEWIDTITENVTVRAGVVYQSSLKPQDDFGLRASDLPGTAWELIPFSFLADYVYNVGDYIEGLMAPARANMLASFTVTHAEITIRREVTGIAAAAPWVAVRQPTGSMTCTRKLVSRDVSGFTASIAHQAIYDWANRPRAQLQNVLSLLTNLLSGIKNHKYR